MSVVVSCTYENKGHRPYLLVAFDTSKRPIRVDVNKKGTRVSIPPNARFLIASLVAEYESDYGQFVNTIEGRCSLTLDKNATNAPMKHAADESFVSGYVTTELENVSNLRIEASLVRSKDGLVLDRLCENNMRWYISNSMKPYSNELRHIQIPYLNGLALPGFCFMLDMPVEQSPESFFNNCVRNILIRRRWSPEAFSYASIEQRAIVCLEAMQAVANHFLYITDYKIDERGTKTEVDVFSSIARVISGGDCEDTAKEICMLCYEWQTRTFEKGSLASYGAKALRHYVCALGLGSVRGPKLGTQVESLLAHAFVMLTPRARFQSMLQGTGLTIDVPTDDDANEGSCMLVGDGTNLKLVDERKKTEPHVGFKRVSDVSQILRTFFGNVHKKGDRFKTYGNQGIANDFYVDIVSCMPLGIRSTKTNQSVLQVYFCNEKGNVYGAPFASVNDSSKSLSVRIRPTVEPTQEDLDTCSRTMRSHGFPPIPAHEFKENGREELFEHMCRVYAPDEGSRQFATMKMAGLDVSALCLKRTKNFNAVQTMLELFVSYEDAFSDDIVRAVRDAASHANMDGLYLFPEYFSETAYGIQILIYSTL
jgi:hypothetical protein